MPEGINVRELLKEARDILGDAYYDGVEPLSDGTRAMIAKVIKRIDAALSAPAPDAMEIVDKLEKLLNMDQAIFPPQSSYSEAAAMIDAYAKQVPEKLLSIIYNMPLEFYSDWLDHAKEICQDFGYTVKEST